jgi:hypothetical protein
MLGRVMYEFECDAFGFDLGVDHMGPVDFDWLSGPKVDFSVSWPKLLNNVVLNF